MSGREYVPAPGELNAHVRTAVDSSVRWLDRALETPGHDREAWDQHTFYARMILMRGCERGELLGWSLQRDTLAAGDSHRAMALKQATAYWSEARPDMHNALAGLRRAADIPLADPAARNAVRAARDQLEHARSWLTDLAEGLAASHRAPTELARNVEQPAPEPSYGRDFL